MKLIFDKRICILGNYFSVFDIVLVIAVAYAIVNAPVSAPTTKTTNISQISKSFTTKDPVLEQVAMESFP